MSDKLRAFEVLLLPQYHEGYIKTLFSSLCGIKLPSPYDARYKVGSALELFINGIKKLLEVCDQFRRQQTSMKQSSGFTRQGAGKHIQEDMSSALREAEKFVRPEFKEKEVEERRKFLNSIFFGETTADLFPLATSVCSFHTEIANFLGHPKDNVRFKDKGRTIYHRTCQQAASTKTTTAKTSSCPSRIEATS